MLCKDTKVIEATRQSNKSQYITGMILLSWWRKTLPPPPASHLWSTGLVAETTHCIFGNEIIRDSSNSVLKADGEGNLVSRACGNIQVCYCRHRVLQCAFSSLFWHSARAKKSVHAKKPFGLIFCYLFFLPGGLPHGAGMDVMPARMGAPKKKNKTSFCPANCILKSHSSFKSPSNLPSLSRQLWISAEKNTVISWL